MIVIDLPRQLHDGPLSIRTRGHQFAHFMHGGEKHDSAFFVVAAALAFHDPVGWVEADVSHSRSVKQPTFVFRFSSNRLLQIGGCESKPVQGEMVGVPSILAAVEVGSCLVTMGIEVPRDNFRCLAYTLHTGMM